MSTEVPGSPEVQGGAPGAPSKDERMMAMLAHILGIVVGFLGPLIIWLMKKDESAFVNDQGKEALNFQITVTIVWIAAGILANAGANLGCLVYPVVGIANLVFCIMGGLKANEGVLYRYPVTLRLIK